MRVSVDSLSFEIDDKLASYSPLLRTMMTTENSTFEKEGDAFVIDTYVHVFLEYLKFLLYEDFEMTKEVEWLFDYMGHPNTLQYPLDYWKIKLRDNWLRDMYEKMELWHDPYFGLIEIEKKCADHIPVMPGFVVAGGAALYLATNTESHRYRPEISDVDFFAIQPDGDVSALNERIKSITFSSSQGDIGDTAKTVISQNALNTYTSYYRYTPSDRFHWRHLGDHLQRMNMRAQYILRMYRSPSEVVHGFDLDACGILWDGKKLWATERALYALKNKCNWFDPMRASPSYAYRLAKYKMKKGFDIRLPLIRESHFNQEAMNEIRRKMIEFLLTHLSKLADANKSDYRDDDPTDERHFELLVYIHEHTGRRLTRVQMSDLYSLGRLYYNTHNCNDGTLYCYVYQWLQQVSKENGGDQLITEWKAMIPRDDISILLLAQYHQFYSHTWKKSDYCAVESVPVEEKEEEDEEVLDREYGEPDDIIEDEQEVKPKPVYTIIDAKYRKVEGRKYYPLATYDTSTLSWKTQDPGTQVTSTFTPTPILSLEEHYSQSPLYTSN